ncbi:ABC transporter permease [Kiritimatiellota bacterium B12222]|nr:ABC transporter permease [Kiritimatiellota bacterium B12222]
MFAMINNAFSIALKEIRRNLTRAFLTVLGIIIGVSSVVTMVTLGEGTTEAVKSQISSLGSNLLMVRPGAGFGPRSRSAGVPDFTEADVDALLRQVPGIAAVAPVRNTSTSAIYRENARMGGVTGTNPGWFEINNWTLESGRFFTDDDLKKGAAVCVIGQTVVDDLFADEDPIGKKIRVGKASVEVIGTLKEKGQVGMGDQDDTLVVPLSTLRRRLLGQTSAHDIGMISISAEDGVDSDWMIENIETVLRERRNLQDNQENDFSVMDTRQIAETLSSSTQVMTTLLATVSGVSLLVGGIGIMNIMLVSVTERTREIGIRLAIGATAKEVLLQFLVEAITLSSVGGAMGIVLALGFCTLLAPMIQVNFIFNTQINIIAFIFSAVVGVVFGFAPARRAASLDPIDALRHE